MAESLEERLVAHAVHAGIQLGANRAELIARYLTLLARWNRAINLTALPLAGFPAETLDRLVLEPLAAAAHVPPQGQWVDVGSGGGSPAVPLKIVRPDLRLAMVESRAKKAAFLREVVRSLSLSDATVIDARLEQMDLGVLGGAASLVTIRAVQLDLALLAVVSGSLAPGGRLLIFTSHQALEQAKSGRTQLLERAGLKEVARVQLPSEDAWLRILEKDVFHVEHV